MPKGASESWEYRLSKSTLIKDSVTPHSATTPDELEITVGSETLMKKKKNSLVVTPYEKANPSVVTTPQTADKPLYHPIIEEKRDTPKLGEVTKQETELDETKQKSPED